MAKRVKILAFDTSFAACSAAILNENEIKVLHEVVPMQQAAQILPMLNALLDFFSLSLNELDAIAYACGPGSFTGIRIASSVAQGLVFVTHKPIIRLSTLAAMAQTAYLEDRSTKLFVAVDARMNQIYWALYEINRFGLAELIGEERVSSPKAVKIPEHVGVCEGLHGIGDGFLKYRAELTDCLGGEPKRISATLLPTAYALLELAKIKLAEGEWVDAFDALPTYLR